MPPRLQGPNRKDELEKQGVFVSSFQIEDRDRVGQGASDRLVDEHGLVSLEDRSCLFEMRSAVDTLEQDDVDLRQQFVNRADNRYPKLFAQVFGEPGNTVAARRYVRAAARISSDNTHSGHFGLRSRGVQKLRERNDVRRVQADDAGTEGIGR